LTILRSVSGGIAIKFYGVRGSTPCTGPEFARYGGHSSCVVLEAPDQQPIVFDLGTGLRPYGLDVQGIFNGTALLSHLHWDHVQGLPFFVPLHQEGATLDVYGPRQADGPLGGVFEQMMRPPFFPIRPTDLIGDVRFHDTADDDFPVGLAKVRSRWVRHCGPTLGFRVEWNGVSVAYLPDHGPGTVVTDADDYVPPEVLELCDGVDVLIHDAQHTLSEYEPKRHWGHCTIDYAVLVAREAGARNLVLFHHDPIHGDDEMDRIGRDAGELGARMGVPEVSVARDGMTLQLDAQPSEVPGAGRR
jgi:phosphoribosyl 1,2-cyclic phosphodiesterase